MKEIAEWLADRVLVLPTEQEKTNFIFAETQRLLDGIFTAAYWKKATIVQQEFFDSTPTNEDLPPGKLYRYKRPRGVIYTATEKKLLPWVYGYKDPWNRPSHVTYSDGTPSISPSYYFGQTQGEVFKDVQWRWLRTVFKLNQTNSATNMPPTLLVSTSNNFVNASLRPARGMLALTHHAKFTELPTTDLDNLKPPLRPAWSSYWRYAVPFDGFSPYQATIQRKIVMYAKRVFKRSNAETYRAAIVKSGIRPLQGIGYNNNTFASMSLSETLDLWQPRPCTTVGANLKLIETGLYWVPSFFAATPTPVNLDFLQAHLFSVTGDSTHRIARPVTGTAGILSVGYTGGTINQTASEARHLSVGSTQRCLMHAENATEPLYFNGIAGDDAHLFHTLGNEIIPWDALDKATPTDENLDGIYEFCGSLKDAKNKKNSAEISLHLKYFYHYRVWVTAATCSIQWPIGGPNNSQTEGELLHSYDVETLKPYATARIAEIVDAWPRLELWHITIRPPNYCILQKEGLPPIPNCTFIGFLPRIQGVWDYNPNVKRIYDGFDASAFFPYVPMSHGQLFAIAEIDTWDGILQKDIVLMPDWGTDYLPTHSFTEFGSYREEKGTIITDQHIFYQP